MRKIVTVIIAVTVLAWGEVVAQPIDAGLYLRFDHRRLFLEDVSEVDGVDVEISYRVNRHLHSDVMTSCRYEDTAETAPDLGGSSFKRGGGALVDLVSVYTDVAKLGVLTSYVGGGVGLFRGKFEASTVSPETSSMLTGSTRTSLAWQLVMGIDVDIAPNWTVDGSYRYFGLGKASVGNLLVLGDTISSGAAVISTKMHEARVGIRYQF